MTKKQVKSKRLIAAKNLKRGLIGLFAILAIIFIINSPILKIFLLYTSDAADEL